MTPAVALIYDDGPSQWTHPILEVLKKADARATFFVLGCNIAANEAAMLRIIRDGHEVAIHGWDHTPVEELDEQAFRHSIRATAGAIVAYGGDPVWWHPPWNRVTPEALEVIEELGYRHGRATIDAGDVSKKQRWILDWVVPQLKEGEIIGLHDGIARNGQQFQPTRLQTVRATRSLLKYCRSVTISELLA